MLATLCPLRDVFIRKDVSVQIGEMDDSVTNPGHPCRGEDLMGDERGPDRCSVYIVTTEVSND